MPVRRNKILILGLGNDILGDDAVGLYAARELQKEIQDNIDVVEAVISGFEIMDVLEGYKKVLLLDAVVTNQHPPGTILELSKEQFKNVVAISPHYMGLPEVFLLAKEMKIDFPKEIRILAMEIKPPYEVREGLSSDIMNALPDLISKGKDILSKWSG
jgi:hydrogenase maturation protease